MARAKAKPDDKSLYERDFNLWVDEQIALLEASAFERLDLANLIEEIADMARSQRKAIRSDLVVLLPTCSSGSTNPEIVPRAGPAPLSSTGVEFERRSRIARALVGMLLRSSGVATTPRESRQPRRPDC
jgi:hypothetical protein